MKKWFLLFVISFILTACESPGGSSYTSMPTTTTMDCPNCNGGIILNPYDGNYYYCNQCKGSGKITKNRQPSFTGSGGCADCSCPKFQGTINDQYCTRCRHPWGRHK